MNIQQKEEIEILFFYLKEGYSTRIIDKKLGYDPVKSKGWKSWGVLKKYGINEKEKKTLFVYPKNQTKRIIKEIIKNNGKKPIQNLIENIRPENLKRFKDSWVITSSPEALYQITNGETRNLIRNFFLTKKKIIGECQYKKCKETKALETAHYLKSRPQIFIEAANKLKNVEGDNYKFNLSNIFEEYLLQHKHNKAICFLCKTHHREFDKKSLTQQEKAKFKRNIIWP